MHIHTPNASRCYCHVTDINPGSCFNPDAKEFTPNQGAVAADPVLHRDEFTGRTKTPATSQTSMRSYLNADATEFRPRGLNPEAWAFLPAEKVGIGTKAALLISNMVN